MPDLEWTMIDEQEVAELARLYGEPLREHYDLEIGPSLFYSRFQRHGERRGEVVLAIERPSGQILLHTKSHYAGIYRLLSGGIDPDEPVLEAVHREAEEETGLRVVVEQFLAVLTYQFRMGSLHLPFVSYVFHLREAGGRLSPDWFEVEDLIEVWPHELPAVAKRLRNIQGERADWGRWRALAHDVVAVISER